MNCWLGHGGQKKLWNDKKIPRVKVPDIEQHLFEGHTVVGNLC